VSFSLMLNLVSAADASAARTSCGASCRATSPARRRRRSRCWTAWPATRSTITRTSSARRKPSAPRTDKERAAILDLLARLKALPSGRQDAELIQNEVFAVGKDHGFEPLRAWFQALYEVLLGQSQGPRFGSFAAIFGIDRTIALIEEKLG
jgi:lysyl-tRNA synthetase class 1